MIYTLIVFAKILITRVYETKKVKFLFPADLVR